MSKPLTFDVLATAATAEQVTSPAFAACVENWTTIAKRIVIVVLVGTKVPDFKKVRIIRVSFPEVTLGQVISAGVTAIMNPNDSLIIADPFCVFGTKALAVLAIATDKQLGTSWMVTGSAVKLDKPTDTDGPLETEILRFFIAPHNIWNFAARTLPTNILFRSPLWGATLGTWALDRVPKGKYHDITELGAVAVLPHVEPEPPGLEGFGRLTFNPPELSYVKRPA